MFLSISSVYALKKSFSIIPENLIVFLTYSLKSKETLVSLTKIFCKQQFKTLKHKANILKVKKVES